MTAKYRNTGKWPVFLLLIIMTAGIVFLMQIGWADCVYAGEKYTSKPYKSGAKVVRIFTMGNFRGVCCQPGVSADDSGTCEPTELRYENSEHMKYMRIAYYWGVKNGWLNKNDVVHTQKLTHMIQYQRVGRDKFIREHAKYDSRAYATSSADEARKNIATALNKVPASAVPRTFRMYFCAVSKGQNFMAWDHENSWVKLVKKSKPAALGTALDAFPGYDNKTGIVYSVYSDANCKSGYKVGELVCRKNGTSNKLALYPGKYWIKETKTNGYFKRDDTVVSKTLKKNKTTQFQREDPPVLGEISIRKIFDKRDREIDTFHFTLTRKDGRKTGIPIIKVKSDGVPVKVPDIPAGDYILDEVLTDRQMADGITPITGARQLTVKPGDKGEDHIFTQENTQPDYRGLRIRKVTSSGGPVAGFHFRVTARNTENHGSITEKDILDAADLTVMADGTEEEIEAKWRIPEKAIQRLNEAARAPHPGRYEITAEATFMAPETESSDTVKTGSQGSGRKSGTDAGEGTGPDTDAGPVRAAEEEPGQTGEDEAGADPAPSRSAEDSDPTAGNGSSKDSGAVENSDRENEEPATGNAENSGSEAAANPAERPDENKGEKEDPSAGEHSSKPEEEAPGDEKEVRLQLKLQVTVGENPNAAGTQTDIRILGKRTERCDEGYRVTMNDMEWMGAARPLQILPGQTAVELTTRDDGWAYLPGAEEDGLRSSSGHVLPSGIYTVEEVMNEAQQARYLQPDPQTVVLKEGEAKVRQITFTNRDNPVKVIVQKSSTDDVIGGVEFRMTGKDVILGDINRTAETGSDGEADLGTVYGGDFVIEETSFDPAVYVNNYKIEGYSNPVQMIHIDGNTNVDTAVNFSHEPRIVSFENKTISKLFITKVDKDTDRFLKDAVFELREEGGEKVAEFAVVLNDDGSAGIKMYQAEDGIKGRYMIEEEEGFLGEDNAYSYAVIEGLQEGKTYTLTEVTPPSGYQQEFSETFTFQDLMKILVPNEEPQIRTLALDQKTGLHQAKAGEAATIVDRVEYANLKGGKEYRMEASLVYRSKAIEPEPVRVGDQEVTASKVFTAEKEGNGSIEIPIPVDARNLAGKSVVVCEELYDPFEEEGKQFITSHADTSDEDQTIDFPGIRTRARDGKTGLQVSNGSEEITIRDTVTYENLLPGDYLIKGVLMDKRKNSPYLEKGKAVTAEMPFTVAETEGMERSSGSVQVAFKLERTVPEAVSLVVFEELYAQGKLIAEHKDIDDRNQTVDIPGIRTNAIAKDTQDHVSNAGKTGSIIDVVTYENLRPGKTYTLTGILVDRSSGEEIMEDGKPIMASANFTPQAGADPEDTVSGQVRLEFSIDTTSLKGRSVVCFEELFLEGNLIGAHRDIHDEDQTVDIPGLRTEAVSEDSMEHIALADGDVVITDTVSYENLIRGQVYTLRGALMNRETGEPILVRGKPVRGEASFKAGDSGEEGKTGKEAYDERQARVSSAPQRDALGSFMRVSGTAKLRFLFDGRDLAGTTAVAFEELYLKKSLIGEHKDLTDEAQSVTLPSLGTKAQRPSKDRIRDTVTYRGLIPGKRYVMSGVLMDKGTGKEIPGTISEKEFVPKRTEGRVTIDFDIDAVALRDKVVVVFEECFLVTDVGGEERPVTVAEHKDIDDSAQTVNFSLPPKTGQSIPWIVISLGLLSMIIGIQLLRRGRRSSNGKS